MAVSRRRSLLEFASELMAGVVLVAFLWSIVVVLPVLAIRGELDVVGGADWTRASYLLPLGFALGYVVGHADRE